MADALEEQAELHHPRLRCGAVIDHPAPVSPDGDR
jgi:hypothetical protein